MNANKVGVLLAQLGTPDAPTPQAVRPYLREFLSDMRVVDYSPWIWQPILRGIILRVRPRRSARLYARIWTPEGSPLLLYSRAQAAGLQTRLGEAFRVVVGMRYGNPSIRSAIETMEAEGISRIVVLSAYPQYSCTTTASIYDAVYTATAGRRCPLFHERKRFVPALRFIEPYYEHPEYIAALQAHLQATVARLANPPDHYLLSFHGVPKRYIDSGDPYRAQCESTATLLAEAMGWQTGQWTLAFQSRFGPEAWLEPYTEAVIGALHARGVRRPLVVTPGFTADCLETLDELGHEGRKQFVEGGGTADDFHLAACLNDHPRWLDAMAALVRRNTEGWV